MADAKAELHQLAARYATAVDSGDADGFAALFHPDATIRMFRPGDGGEPSVDIGGNDGLRAIPGSLALRYTATLHLVGHAVYDVEAGGEATGSVYCLAHHLDRGSGTDHVMHIVYRDRYRRDDDGRWRFVSREGSIPWTETRSVDPLPDQTAPVGVPAS
jgi:ketosteroid isomerase-like protein